MLADKTLAMNSFSSSSLSSSSSCWCCPDCLSSLQGDQQQQQQQRQLLPEQEQQRCPSLTRDGETVDSSGEAEDIYEFDTSHPLFHVSKALRCHPLYLRSLLGAYTHLMHESGPLPFGYRVYIGIMAVSRHQCQHLMNLLVSEFLSYHGDEKWLGGLHHAPEKLRNLDEINRMLAHRPWLLKPSHILKLTKGGKENWSISELTQAIVILASHHSLVSLFASCGIGVQKDASPPASAERESGRQPLLFQRQASEVYGIDILLERMKLVEAENSDDFTREERLARFKDVERQSVDLLNSKRRRKSKHSPPVFCPFTFDPDFCYEDFSTQMAQMSDLQPYAVMDYSWETHGYVVASMYYNDSAPLLDDKFRVARKLTYNTVGTYPNVDTSTFRTAVWNYAQCMLGIMHDDYDYDVVNTLLEKNLRSYVKAVTCFPETVTRAMYEGFMKDLLPSEKVHINIMIHEARFQAELMYAFRTVVFYMAKDW